MCTLETTHPPPWERQFLTGRLEESVNCAFALLFFPVLSDRNAKRRRARKLKKKERKKNPTLSLLISSTNHLPVSERWTQRSLALQNHNKHPHAALSLLALCMQMYVFVCVRARVCAFFLITAALITLSLM